MGELVQLHMGDVHLEEDVPHLSINDDNCTPGTATKHVKSAAGIRRVPLHPDVLAMGFRKFVAQQRQRNRKSPRLFAEVPYGSDGQASTVFSKGFARFLDHIGLTEPSLVFHSFRHNAEDAFRDALQPQYVIERIIGHSDGAVSYQYGNGISLDVASEAIKAMRLQVRLPILLASWQRSEA